MTISQVGLARLYVWAVLLGAFLGLVYDALRVTRILLGAHYNYGAARRLTGLSLPLLPPRPPKGERRSLGTVVFFEDFFFCIFAGVSLILLLYGANSGRFRAWTVLCAAVGFFVYRATLGRVVMLLSEWIAFLLGAAMRYLLFFTTMPLRWLWGRTTRAIGRFFCRRWYAGRKRARRHYTRRMLKRSVWEAGGLLPNDWKQKIGGRQRDVKSKKAVQPYACDAAVSRGDDRDVDRRVRQSRHAVQCTARGAKASGRRAG